MCASNLIAMWVVSLSVSVMTTLAIAWIPYLREIRKSRVANRIAYEEWKKKVGL